MAVCAGDRSRFRRAAHAFLPFPIMTTKAEHIATYFEPFEPFSAFAGIGPADVHNRDPRLFPLVTGGARIVGDGILATND